MNEHSKRVVFMGGKQIGYSCLSFLLQNANTLSIEVVGVFESVSKISSEEHSVGALCKEFDIPVYYDSNDLFKIDHIDFIVSVQYGRILNQDHINKARKLAVNVHMAPLPEYRGCNQFSFAIIDNISEFGTSIHRLEASIDGGDLIVERRFKIPEDCFVQDLHQVTVKETLLLFKAEIGNIINGNFSLIPQSELSKHRNSGFHLRNEIDQIKMIDASWSLEKKKRHFRATWFPPFSPPTEIQSGKSLDMNWYNSTS